MVLEHHYDDDYVEALQKQLDRAEARYEDLKVEKLALQRFVDELRSEMQAKIDLAESEKAELLKAKARTDAENRSLHGILATAMQPPEVSS